MPDMRPDKASDFYEKLYFHEIDNKDKIHSRAQASFGLIVIAMTILTYLAKNTSIDSHPYLASFVLYMVATSFIMVLFSSYLMIRVIWGNRFRYCPDTITLNEHHQKLIEHERVHIEYCEEYGIKYEGTHDPNSMMVDYLNSEIILSAAHNSNINEKRTKKLYDALWFFFWSLLPLIIAVILFLLADLDAASPRNKIDTKYLIIPLENIRRT